MITDIAEISRFLSLILRHQPDKIGIALDAHGWADVGELIAGVNKTRPFSMAQLEEIVSSDNKQRFAFNGDKTLIRANQGHSVQVDAELQQLAPPEYLFHGTGEKYVASIEKTGLIPKSRLYVHLSPDAETAAAVGSRHGRPVVFRIESGRMHGDGYLFYRSLNGVWLAKAVPFSYMERIRG